jgi:hypothetical protein
VSADTDREPDTVVFTVSHRTDYIVKRGESNFAAEPRSDGGTLEEVGLYAEGEYAGSYMRGATIDAEDAPLILEAADVAGLTIGTDGKGRAVLDA